MIYQVVSTCTPYTCLRSSSLHHGDACRAAASCFDPRRVSDLHDGVQHGRQPSPSRIGLLSGTLHTRGESAGTVFSPFAKLIRTLVQKQSVLLPDGELCASHSTSGHRESMKDSQDAYMVYLVSTARLPPFRHTKKGPTGKIL